MSVCVNIRTEKALEPKDIFQEFVNRGESIMVTSRSFPSIKLGTINRALRGIEINQEDNGYEVRVCTFANRADLDLFVVAIEVIKSMTGSKAFYEDDDECEITNPADGLDEDWKGHQLEESINVNCTLVKHFGQAVIMDGLFFLFCFGPRLALDFEIDLSHPTVEDLMVVQEYLTKMQWNNKNKKGTLTDLTLGDQSGEQAKSLSIISVKDGKVNDFDYVAYADFLLFINNDNERMVIIPMDDFGKIAPAEYFELMDDYQFLRKEILTLDVFNEMMENAHKFQVENPFFKSTFPGSGYVEEQKTYVLMWNPDISSIKMNVHNESIPYILTDDFNWSVYEYQEAQKGDRFVMVRCGEGKTGIVMSGIFNSNPYQDEDWSGKGRKVFYMDMTPNFIANPEEAEIITTTELQAAIPSFDWTGGYSGRLLTEEQAQKLEELLAAYLKRIADKVDGETINGFQLPN